jgi:hypothetical protein
MALLRFFIISPASLDYYRNLCAGVQERIVTHIYEPLYKSSHDSFHRQKT